MAVDNEALNELLVRTNILIDGLFKLAERDLSLRFRGSPNQRIIDVKRSLKENKVIIINY